MKKIKYISVAVAVALSFSICTAYARNDKDFKGDSDKDNERTEQNVKISVDAQLNNANAQVNNVEKEELKDKAKDKVEALKDRMEELREKLKEVREEDREKRKELIRKITKERKLNKDDSIPVFVGGKEVEFDVPPVIKFDRTLIPVRAVTAALGADVQWDESTATATVTKAVYSDVYGAQTVKIELNLETRVVKVNGNEVGLDVPPQLVNNRTMVPLRFIAETFRKDVDWDDISGSVIIEDKKK